MTGADDQIRSGPSVREVIERFFVSMLAPEEQWRFRVPGQRLLDGQPLAGSRLLELLAPPPTLTVDVTRNRMLFWFDRREDRKEQRPQAGEVAAPESLEPGVPRDAERPPAPLSDPEALGWTELRVAPGNVLDPSSEHGPSGGPAVETGPLVVPSVAYSIEYRRHDSALFLTLADRMRRIVVREFVMNVCFEQLTVDSAFEERLRRDVGLATHVVLPRDTGRDGGGPPDLGVCHRGRAGVGQVLLGGLPAAEVAKRHRVEQSLKEREAHRGRTAAAHDDNLRSFDDTCRTRPGKNEK